MFSKWCWRKLDSDPQKNETVQRKGNPPALLVGMQTGAATLENSVEVPQKIKNRPTL